jgi:hypothetical protein
MAPRTHPSLSPLFRGPLCPRSMARRDNSFRGSLVLLRALCVSLLCASSDATWAPRRATAWVHASDDALRTPLPRLRLQGVPRRLLLSESESPSDEFEESDAEAAPPSLLGGGLCISGEGKGEVMRTVPGRPPHPPLLLALPVPPPPPPPPPPLARQRRTRSPVRRRARAPTSSPSRHTPRAPHTSQRWRWLSQRPDGTQRVPGQPSAAARQLHELARGARAGARVERA